MNALEAGEDSRLDPKSSNFQYQEWLRYRYETKGLGQRGSFGVAYWNLSVHGFGTTTDYQKTFASYPLAIFNKIGAFLTRRPGIKIEILRDFEGLVNSGEILMVLGRPGSGCTTLLKTLSGRTEGLHVNENSRMNFQGISMTQMHTEFRGECTYHAESDIHFPHLTVGQTLALPARARASKTAILACDSSRAFYARDTKDATLAALNILGAIDTKIGNAFVQGASGGERKRASIAEIMVGESPVQCWDNSTRGLDSANALDFVKALRHSTTITGSIAIISLYQASQDIYDTCDKVIVLYEGHQIFFGKASIAREYFIGLGFYCSERTTTGDFLISITNPSARVVRSGYEARVPRTPKDFVVVWNTSPLRKQLLNDIEEYSRQFPLDGQHLRDLRMIRKAQKAVGLRQGSPYMIGFPYQVYLCLVRGIQVLRNDFAPPMSAILGNAAMSIILGSMFYNMPEDTSSFFGRGVLLFFTILLNAFLGSFEGVALWDQRPVVEKHYQLALYRPMAEAIASMICDLPNKLLLTLGFNVPFYFLANLRRTPAAFFIFYLFAFLSLLTGSMLFRAIGALSRTLTASIAPGAVFILMLVIYTGFVIPIPDMHVWFRWFGYLDPVAYAFESLMINEFDGREFNCVQFIPSGPAYANISSPEHTCAVLGADIGSSVVQGGAYIAAAFQYQPEHLWRNFGIIIGMAVLICSLYLLATEYVSIQGSQGEVLLFPRSHLPARPLPTDEETQSLCEQSTSVFVESEKNKSSTEIAVETDIAPLSLCEQPTSDFVVSEKNKSSTEIAVESDMAPLLWDNINFDVTAKEGHRRLLHGVQGWIEPSSLTAVMGPSGAGKTTLLNVLANRCSYGISGGEKITAVENRDEHSFARKVGYAQQSDFHLPTSTVKEALEFSALLRQSENFSRQEKLAYVTKVIAALDMTNFAEAVIGVPGEGLNVEQRKKLTIGVELAVRPELLLFLDEPTSGLDSNTAWAICKLLRQLANNGQSILTTIHQPSGDLFQMFDRLLFLAEGGKTVYFGDIGPNCETLTSYFERHGARKCLEHENPAEWLLEVTSGRASGKSIDWYQVWQQSEEQMKVAQNLERMKQSHSRHAISTELKSGTGGEFATSFWTQLLVVTRRNLMHDWRTPSYLYSKAFLTVGSGLVNGFSFWHSANDLQGSQNQLFSVFLLMTLFSNLVQLIMPQFIGNRVLYEARESPSKVYSWPVFMLSNVIAEIPWQTIMAVLLFLVWYYPLGMYLNSAPEDINERAGLTFLFVWSFMIFSSTFSQMVIAGLPDAPLGVNIASLLYSLSLIFCGVLVSPAALPRFWVWMVRTTPVTYFVGGLISTGIGHISITCSADELVVFDPPTGVNCGTYLAEYMSYAGGTLLDPSVYKSCQFCPVASTDALLGALGIYYGDRWRNLGITLAFSMINVLGAMAIYWLFRVPKNRRK